MRDFEITFFKKEKFGEPSIRTTIIRLPKSTGNIGKDSKTALNIFIANFGNLKTYEVTKIQEIGKDGPIGDPILPMEDTTIVPLKKKVD